jgi:hypothetical protein
VPATRDDACIVTAAHPIRCRCGQLQARLDHPDLATRAICYCRDCRAYAHFLGPPEGLLDALGGTEVAIVRPRRVAFTAGLEHLACMSLSPRGIYRWYARCCRTPIGNTPRDHRIPYLGLVHSCLDQAGPPLDAALGPVRMKVHRHGAHGDPGGTPLVPLALAGARQGLSLAWDRVSGNYRDSAFFDAATGAPRVAPEVISREARQALLDRV